MCLRSLSDDADVCQRPGPLVDGVLTLLRPLPDTGPTWDLGEGSRKTHHVSVLDVNIPSMKASGGIHFTGSIAQPPFR